MNLSQQVARGGLALYFGRNFALVSNILRSIILARMLVPEHFGVVAVGTAIAMVYRRFITLSWPQAAIVYEGDKDEETLFSTQFFLTMGFEGVGFTLLLLALPLVRHWYSAKVAEIATVTGVVLLLAQASSVPVSVLQKRLSFSNLAQIDILKGVFGFGLPVGMAYFGAGIWSLVAAFATEHIVMAFMVWVIYRPFSPKLRFDRSIAKYIIRFGLFLWLGSLMMFFTTQYDRLVLGKLASAATVGAYALASTVASYPFTMLHAPLDSILVPLYVRVRNSREKSIRAEELSFTFILFAAVGVAVLLFVTAPDLITVVYGTQWDASIPMIRALVPFWMLTQVILLLKSLFISTNRSKHYLWMMAIQGASSLVLCPLLTVIWGGVGTSLSLGVGAAAGTAFGMWQIGSKGSVPMRLFLTSSLSGVLGLGVWQGIVSLGIMPSRSVPRLVSGASIVGIVYIAASLLLEPRLLGQIYQVWLRTRLPPVPPSTGRVK